MPLTNRSGHQKSKPITPPPGRIKTLNAEPPDPSNLNRPRQISVESENDTDADTNSDRSIYVVG